MRCNKIKDENDKGFILFFSLILLRLVPFSLKLFSNLYLHYSFTNFAKLLKVKVLL